MTTYQLAYPVGKRSQNMFLVVFLKTMDRPKSIEECYIDIRWTNRKLMPQLEGVSFSVKSLDWLIEQLGPNPSHATMVRSIQDEMLEVWYPRLTCELYALPALLTSKSRVGKQESLPITGNERERLLDVLKIFASFVADLKEIQFEPLFAESAMNAFIYFHLFGLKINEKTKKCKRNFYFTREIISKWRKYYFILGQVAVHPDLLAQHIRELQANSVEWPFSQLKMQKCAEFILTHMIFPQ
jgi:hypothetical protein